MCGDGPTTNLKKIGCRVQKIKTGRQLSDVRVRTMCVCRMEEVDISPFERNSRPRCACGSVGLHSSNRNVSDMVITSKRWPSQDQPAQSKKRREHAEDEFFVRSVIRRLKYLVGRRKQGLFQHVRCEKPARVMPEQAQVTEAPHSKWPPYRRPHRKRASHQKWLSSLIETLQQNDILVAEKQDMYSPPSFPA